MLVAKWRKLLTNIDGKVNRLVAEVTALEPTVSLAIAKSLEDEFATILGLRTQLENLTTAICEADPTTAEAAMETHETQDREISEKLDPAQVLFEAYIRSCKELQVTED